MTNRFPHRASALLALVFVLSAAVTLSSCAPAARVTLARDGSGTATFSGTLGPAAAEAFTRATGGTGGQPAFDPALVREGLGRAGIAAEQVATGSGSSLFMKLSIPDVTALPGGIISRPASGNGIVVTFSRESVNGLVDLMPPETRDALDLLMAPVFTDESLSAAEYEDVLGSAYGKTLRDELRASSLLLSVTCPSTVREATVSAPGKCDVSGAVVTLSLPVSTLLTLENPVQARILW